MGSCPGEAAPPLRGSWQQTLHAEASHTGHSSLLASASTSAGRRQGWQSGQGLLCLPLGSCVQKGVVRDMCSLTCLHAGRSSYSGSSTLSDRLGPYTVRTEQED